jgi:energy-coupling factor transport system ATP-binding protein
VFELVAGLNEQGVTVILVTHVTEAVADHADRVAVLVDGRTWALGTPQEIFQDTAALRDIGIRPPEVTEALQRLFPIPAVDLGSFPIRLSDAVDTYRTLRPEPMSANGAAPQGQPPSSHSAPDPEPARSERTPVLSCRDLVHTYPDGTQALRGLDLDIYEGDYVAIVGQNGAGKSTLVRHFLHLLKRTSGSVHIQGQTVDDFEVSDLAHRIGYVSQNPDNQIFTDSVEDEVAFALRNLGTPPDEIDATVGRVLDEMRLGWARDRHPVTLSKGDRARVVIAAVLAMDPSILVFDEPTIGQDYLGATAILDLTRQLHAGGRTVVLITHHLYLLPGYAERLIVMGKGSVLSDGPLRDGYYAERTLEETFLRAPQLVRFAQSVAGSDSLVERPLTVDELAVTLSAH